MASLSNLFKKNYELFCIGQPKKHKNKGFPNHDWMKKLYLDVKLRNKKINNLNGNDKRKLERLLKDSNFVARKIIHGKLNFEVSKVRKKKEESYAEIYLKDNINGKSKIFVPLVDLAEKTIKEHNSSGYVYNINTHLLGDLSKDSIIRNWKYTPGQKDLMHGEHDSSARIGVTPYDNGDYLLKDLKLTSTGLKLSTYYREERNERDKFEFKSEIMRNIQDSKEVFEEDFLFHPFSPALYDLGRLLKSRDKE